MLKKASDKKHILLVDDDRSVTQMLSMLLETRGYNINIAYSGRDAFNKVSTDTDLIILDLILPDQNGFEVCCRMKEEANTAHIPIIILSAKLFSEDIVEGLYLGADDYLTKPFEYEELIARMEAVMRRGAMSNNGSNQTFKKDQIVKEIRKIIDEELIVPHFHPIYYVDPFKLLGVEVLSRPKTDSVLANPEVLFKAAIQFGFYQDLEILAWKKALEYAGPFLKDEKLFLNCNPYLVEGPKFLSLISLFKKYNISEQNVFLEITERSAVTDFKAFYEQLNRYREYGFKFAIDDVGGGYASLESIVQTRPEVVKIDRHIVHQLEKDEFKKSIVKFIVAFCKENKILSIAEGVETKEDLDAVRKLGIDACQGFYLYKPTPIIDWKKFKNISPDKLS